MNDKQTLYIVSWTQEYPELQEIIDREMNILLELSGYKEAKEVIERIKKL